MTRLLEVRASVCRLSTESDGCHAFSSNRTYRILRKGTNSCLRGSSEGTPRWAETLAFPGAQPWRAHCTSSCPLAGIGFRPVSIRKSSSAGAAERRDAKTMRQYAHINPLRTAARGGRPTSQLLQSLCARFTGRLPSSLEASECVRNGGFCDIDNDRYGDRIYTRSQVARKQIRRGSEMVKRNDYPTSRGRSGL